MNHLDFIYFCSSNTESTIMSNIEISQVPRGNLQKKKWK